MRDGKVSNSMSSRLATTALLARSMLRIAALNAANANAYGPMGLPLMTLMHKQIKDINELFGPYEGGGLSLDAPDALRTFKTDDIEEFM